MTAELSRLAPEIVITGLVCLAVVGSIVAVQWGRVRRHEAELEFTRQLVEQDVPVDEIERLLAKRTPPPAKGLLEQFNALGRGSKAGLIFCAIIAVTMLGNALQFYFMVGRR